MTERDRGSIPEHTQAEVWEIAGRAEQAFMPEVSRPMGRTLRGGGKTPFLAFGLTQAVMPIEGYIQTSGNPRQEAITKIAKADVLRDLLEFGVSATPGDKRIVTADEFPHRTIHHFLLRTQRGLVIQEYELVDGKDHANFPIVLHEQEIEPVAAFFNAIDTVTPHINHPLYSSHPQADAGIPIDPDPKGTILRESEKFLEAQRKEREKPGERLYCKKLSLVTPEHAKRLGIITDIPVFVSETDSTDGRPFVYQTGETFKVSHFEEEGNESVQTTHRIAPRVASLHSRPKYGIGYFDEPAFVMTNGSMFWSGIKDAGWVAILEPAGRIVHHEDYFFAYSAIAEEVRVKEILAFCEGDKIGPLKEGIVINIGNPYLKSVCGYEEHKKEIDEHQFPWFGFYYDRDGKIAFDYSNQD